ncbi:S-layer homology domain-containing protein [Flavonifractor plautii]|uniref:S-layer homology domain-containing protein n=1 Tax=Flavonifractor plautii TaxID=292800 RepID=UPI0018AA5176|nr:S-layer homology domain-containing protein [Flavonifractor plautii]MCB7042722.1 S-layer homology domain-containing protein [Flavonifractor plautii]MCG4707089.1 S-layer homology domain-containing protein [Flavonifractor plautii]MDB7867457.1 S-layer homology domain-containing protein [Flavonifractor plautii]MDB7871161.1 S-layer homology domain-containing protein [Flavonifractor plautii]MDB7884191.1 S-layer homology domain-containing protein [Flavonifractor plautii]
MRNLKRTLSLALASVMLVGMMSVGASAVNASDFTDADEIVNKDAVSTMTALGIINGKEDGSYFDPTGTVTRAEMAKMLCVAINGGVDPVLGVKDTPTFTDIKGHWAESYIEYCAANGIIAGRGNNKFDPTGTVSATEAAKMLLGVLGYNAEKSGLVGNDWAINTNVLANQNGLYKNLSNLNANTLLTRDNAAQMIYNALDANMVELNAAGNYTTSQYSYTGTESVVTGTERVWVLTIKENNCTDSGIKAAVDALSGSVYNSRSDADETVKEVAGAELSKVKYALEQKTQNVYGENTVTKYADETMGHKYLSLITDGDAVLTDVEKDSKGTYTLYMNGITTKGQYTKVEGDYSNLIGQKVEVLYKDSENVYGVYASTDSSLIVESTAGKVGTLSNNEVKIDGTTYKVDSNVTTTALYTGKLIDGLNVGGNKAAAVKAYDNDDNGKIDTVVYVPFTAAKVTYVGEKSFNTDVAGTNIKFEDVNAYDDMAKNDYVIKSDAANTVDDTDTYVLAETVEGKIEATKSDSVRIDGTWYNYVTTTPDKDLALDSTVKAAVLNGYIVKSEVVTSSHELQDYAVVVKTDTDINGPQAKLLFADGTTKVVTTDKKYTDTMGLVTYEVKKGEYVLTEAVTDSADKAGFDKIVTGKYVNNSGKGKIGGESIADDAVIFVKDSAGKFSTMAGSDFAKYSTTSVVDQNITAYANKDNSTGYNSIVLAYVELTGTVNSITSNYGYVTSAVSTTKNDDGETVSSFTFWDGATEHKDIMTDEKVSLSKGDIFTYEENKDGSYTVSEVDNLLRTAIIAYNEKNGDIRFTDASLNSAGSNVNAEITDDTVIIGINSDDKAGVEGVVPTIAIETATSGVYQANAYYVMGVADEVKLLVVDTYGNIPAVDSVTTVTDESNLGTALKQYTDVTFEGNATISSKLEIPAGATLNVKGDLTANAAIVGNGTLNVTGNISDTSKVSTQLESTKTGETVSVSGGVVLGDVTGNVGSGSALYSGDQVKGKVIVQITVPADAVTDGTSKIKFDGSEPSTPTLTNRSDIYLAIDMSQSGQKVITIDKDGDWSSTTNDVYTLTVKW